MKRLLLLAVAITAVSIMAESNANAQGYLNGYQFGTGVSWNRGYRVQDREQQPFFARHPPVYYSHIVKRPYGVSPYPAPAGIMPVEMQIVTPDPLTVANPFFNKQVAPVKQSTNSESESKTENKTTWVVNPHLITLAKK